MSALAWQGALLGGLAGLCTVWIAVRVRAIRRPRLETRVLAHLIDLPTVGRSSAGSAQTDAVGTRLLRAAADYLESALGGASTIRRKLDRAGLQMSVHDFRIEQVVWGLVGFACAAAWGLARSLGEPAHVGVALLLCGAAFIAGAMLRENRLTGQVRRRERQMAVEFPTLAELLALAVAAGESPSGALERVVSRSGGELSKELDGVLAEIRVGVPVAEAFDGLASRTGLGLVGRFAAAVAVAVERGTPLSEVLHAQAADVREAGRRELIETAARKEVLMMVPVVFMVLPVTVLFAFYPGVVGLSLMQ